MLKSRNIEDFGKTIYNYSHIGKVINYCKNANNKNAVFIWIPKNAGTSIYKTLKRHGCLKAKKTERVKYRFSQRGLVTFGHMNYAHLLEQDYIKPEFNKSAFKFCFSRNPYDRAISLFEYFKPSFGKHRSFGEFIKYLYNEKIQPVGLYNNKNFSSCNPQKRWVEELEIDYCGQYESLNEDFNKILKKLKFQPVNLLHLNHSNRRKFEDYYDHDTQKRVEELYYEDFEYFNYPLHDNI